MAFDAFFIWLQGASVGLYFINRPEWIIVDQACSAYSYISVPLYDTLGNIGLHHMPCLVFFFFFGIAKRRSPKICDSPKYRGHCTRPLSPTYALIKPP